jgi:hypothetical protein
MNSGWAISATIDPTSGVPHIAYGNGAFELKHPWALDLIRVPRFPPPEETPNTQTANLTLKATG